MIPMRAPFAITWPCMVAGSNRAMAGNIHVVNANTARYLPSRDGTGAARLLSRPLRAANWRDAS
jgi:hypothetical protein